MFSSTQNQRYITGLDGLRAFAVLSVIAYHFSFTWAGGGFLGVDIFFVISGFLITSKILPSKQDEFKFSLKEFWFGRIRRLLPAVYIMIAVTFLWVLIFNPELVNTLSGDSISSVFYVSNWWFIFHKLSYFDSFGSPSPLKNLWSLAIEEQFYIVWPIVLLVGLKVFKKRDRFAKFIFFIVLCSAMLMSILYKSGDDPSRVYYGTDTRCFELLIGGLLAIVWSMRKPDSKDITIKRRNILNIVSVITFIIFILSVIFINEYQEFLYRGGILLFCLNAAVIIACVCYPGGFLGEILSWKPLRWMGTRSYGIYLWHYPIIVLTTPVYEIGNPSYLRVALQLIATLAIAELSYRYIEMPIRKLGFRGFTRKYLMNNYFEWGRLTLVKRVLVAAVPIVIVVAIIGIASMTKGTQKVSNGEVYQSEVVINGEDQASSDKKSEDKAADNKDTENKNVQNNDSQTKEPENKNSEDKAAASTVAVVSSNVKPQSTSSSAIKAYKQVLAIGDSIMLDIAQNLHKRYTNITIDGKVGRQLSQAIKLAPSYSAFNSSDRAVIIELGTNGYFTEKQLDSLLNSFSKAHIYLINTRVPRQWESTVNKLLKEAPGRRANTTLIDWYSTAIKHPEYFGRDGVHLTSKGVEALTSLIDQALKSNN